MGEWEVDGGAARDGLLLLLMLMLVQGDAVAFFEFSLGEPEVLVEEVACGYGACDAADAVGEEAEADLPFGHLGEAQQEEACPGGGDHAPCSEGDGAPGEQRGNVLLEEVGEGLVDAGEGDLALSGLVVLRLGQEDQEADEDDYAHDEQEPEDTPETPGAVEEASNDRSDRLSHHTSHGLGVVLCLKDAWD